MRIVIDPAVWPAARSFAKRFIADYYPDEADLFDDVADLVEQRLVSLGWIFRISTGHPSQGLGFADTLDSASFLISVCVPMLMTRLPISTKPDPGKVGEEVADIAAFCGAPHDFKEKFQKVASTIYGLDFSPDTVESFEFEDVFEQIAFDGEVLFVPLDKINSALSTAKSVDSKYDLVLLLRRSANSTLHLRKSPISSDPKPINPFRKGVKITRGQAEFLNAILQNSSGVDSEKLAKLCNITRYNKQQGLADIKSKLVRRVEKVLNLSSRDCWLEKRIKSSERLFYIIRRPRFCIFRRVLKRA